MEVNKGSKSPGGTAANLFDAATGALLASARVEDDDKWKSEVERLRTAPCRIRADVGGASDRHFVVVDAVAADSTAVYRDAAKSQCKPARTCVVMYWDDEHLAASKMPLSTAQARSLAAQFTRSPATGNERLLVRCRGGEASGSCLRQAGANSRVFDDSSAGSRGAAR